MLLGLLRPCFVWRTRWPRRQVASRRGWTRAQSRHAGLAEAALKVAWTVACLAVVHALA